MSLPRVSLAVGTSFLLSLLLCIHLWPNRVSLRLGDLAQTTITAQRTVRYEDTEATRRLRDDAVAQVDRRYDQIPSATATALESVDSVFGILESAGIGGAASSGRMGAAAMPPTKNEPASAAETVAAEIRRRLGIAVPRESIAALLTASVGQRREARVAALDAARRAMNQTITDDTTSLRSAQQELPRDAALRSVPAPLRPHVAAVAAASLVPNRAYNPRDTEHDRQSAAVGVPPQMRRMTAGSAILKPGERVAQHHLDAFAALGLQNARLDALTITVISLLVALLVGLVCVYLSLFHADLYRDTPRLFLLALLTVISVVGLKIGSTLLGLPFSGVHFGYLGMMCVASAGMAIALLLSPAVATLIVSLLAVASGLILNNELRFTLITLGSSLVGIVSVVKLRNRNELVRATLILCGANVLLNVLAGQLEGDTSRELMSGAVWGAVSGIFAVTLFWLGVAVFEKPFGITTHLRLLELSDPATPVLQEFRMRVPGTYAHSLMVGNLAQAAAEAIGADALLVRVAAYYHDLGKMNRPEFYIENQVGGDNIHDRISPYLSALVLASHVKDGLEMAAEVGLPPLVREIIQQHHGTTLMRLFYLRATGGAQDPRLEAQFRYPGPKPQTREAAILMLADTVEAASRTLVKPTPKMVAEFIGKMIEDKRADGQLNECDLTLRDLQTIQEAFSRTLSGTLHARIDYPSMDRSVRPNGAAAAAVPTAPLTLATFPEDALVGALSSSAAVITAAPNDSHAEGADAENASSGPYSEERHGDNRAGDFGNDAAPLGIGADRGGKTARGRR